MQDSLKQLERLSLRPDLPRDAKATLEDIVSRLSANASEFQQVLLVRQFDAIPRPVILVDQATGGVIDANPAACRKYGYTLEEFRHLRQSDFTADYNTENTENLKLDSSIIQAPVVRHRKKSGEEFPAEVKAGTLQTGNRTYTVLLTHDVSRIVRAQQELLRSNERLEAIFASTDDLLLIFDKDGVLVDYRQPPGFPIRDDLMAYVGKHYSAHDLEPTLASLLDEHFHEALSKAGVVRFEFDREIEGIICSYESTLSPMFQRGSITGMTMRIKDNSESKRDKQLLTMAHAISELTHTANDIGDFYNGISAILSATFRVRDFYISLHDPVSDTLSFPLFEDSKESNPGIVRAGTGLTEFVLKTGTSVLATPEVFQRLLARGDVQDRGAPSIDWLGVPLKQQDRTFGVLAVQSYDAQRRFRSADVASLENIAHLITVAINRMDAEQRIIAAGITDPLTGLHNRLYWNKQLAALQQSGELPVGIIMADLDDLKVINDQYGHLQGDVLIKAAALILASGVRKHDHLVRWGGDEYAVLLPGADERATMEAISRIRKGLKAYNEHQSPRLGISMGYAVRCEPGSLEDTVKAADDNLLLAKQRKNNCAHAH